MLKHASKQKFSLAILAASITLAGCGGSSEQEMPTDGEPVARALNPAPSVTETADTGIADTGIVTDLDTEVIETIDEIDTDDNVIVDLDTDMPSEVTVPDTAGLETTGATDTTTATESTQGVVEQAEAAPPAELPPGFSGAIDAVTTPNGSDPFSKFQLDDSIYTNNVYDGRQLDPENNWKLIFYDGVQDFVRWEVPALLGNSPNPCERPHSGDPVALKYRLTSRKDSPHERNTFVRSYPAMVVGSMGGRYESWGVECGQVGTILPSVQRHGGSPVYQMETVAAATGLPVLASDLNYDVRVSVKADLNTPDAAHGIANVFMDSYWHNVSDVNLVPGNQSALVNTINGISSDYTEVWNLNIWFDYPRNEGTASSWTGGFKIGSVMLQEGGLFDVYFKIEGARDGHLPRCRLGTNVNCFLYVGLVATDNDAARNGVTINYTEIADWMRSSDFRDLFLTGAFETDTPAAKAYTAWQMIDGSENDTHPDPAKRGPRFPDEAHVIGGIHLGAELWYNPDAVPATLEFEALGVEVDGFGQFGNYIEYE